MTDFKVGDNYPCSAERNMWRMLKVSSSSRPEIEIWQIFDEIGVAEFNCDVSTFFGTLEIAVSFCACAVNVAKMLVNAHRSPKCPHHIWNKCHEKFSVNYTECAVMVIGFNSQRLTRRRRTKHKTSEQTTLWKLKWSERLMLNLSTSQLYAF